jgi:hypothetical protein
MERPQLVNIWNKQSRISGKGWLPVWALDKGLTSDHCKKKVVTKYYTIGTSGEFLSTRQRISSQAERLSASQEGLCSMESVLKKWFDIPSHNSSVGIALGYGLDDRGSSVRFLVGAGNYSLHHGVQNGSGAHPASYPMGTKGSFPGGKAAGSWSRPLTPV